MQPYVKSYALFVSPLDAIPPGVSGVVAGTRLMSFGYNYAYLNPQRRDGSYKFATIADITQPSLMILFADRTSSSSLNLRSLTSFGKLGLLDIGNIDPPAQDSRVGAKPAPTDILTMSSWGVDNRWVSSNVVNDHTDGALTGLVSFRAHQMSSTAFTDGHAKAEGPRFFEQGAGMRGGPVVADLANAPAGGICIKEPHIYPWCPDLGSYAGRWQK